MSWERAGDSTQKIVCRGGAASPDHAEYRARRHGLSAKKQVFANALKRVNARLAKIEEMERRARALASLQAARGRKQAVPRNIRNPAGPLGRACA
jgi:hypothetical protein